MMYDILQLNDMLVPELRELAEQLELKSYKRLNKQELIFKIIDAQALNASSSKETSAPKAKKVIRKNAKETADTSDDVVEEEVAVKEEEETAAADTNEEEEKEKEVAEEPERPRKKIILKKRSERCLLYTSPSPRDQRGSRMPSSA